MARFYKMMVGGGLLAITFLAGTAIAAAPASKVPVDIGTALQTEPAIPKDARQAKDIHEINALWDQITDAYRNRDPVASMDGMIKDDSFQEFDMVMPFSDPGYARNLQKTKAWMDQSKGPTIVDYFDRKIVMLGNNAAYGIAYVRFVGTTIGGDKIDVTARHVRILRKINGRWLCVLEHTSLPVGWSVKL